MSMYSVLCVRTATYAKNHFHFWFLWGIWLAFWAAVSADGNIDTLYYDATSRPLFSTQFDRSSAKKRAFQTWAKTI